jgi:hypothetical protein
MGSRLYYRSIKSGYILILSWALSIILGCPNPNAHIWFISKGKLIPELNLKFADNKISMTVQNFSRLGNKYGKYKIELFVNMKFPREMKGDLLFSPKTIKIYFGGHLMECDSTSDEYLSKYVNKTTTNKYTVGLIYTYDMQTDTSIVASIINGESVKLKIIMDNFIYYKSEPLHIDTILAVEKQPFLY